MRPEPLPSGAVRPALPEDAGALARAHVASWRAAYAGLMPEALLAGFTVEAREGRWREILGRDAPGERTFVATGAGGILGFVSTGPSRDQGAGAGEAEVYGLYLDPGAWGLGLGRALFAAAVADLRERGRVRVTLWVLEGNARGRGFYEARGMRADGGFKVEVEEGVELPHVRYALALGGEGG